MKKFLLGTVALVAFAAPAAAADLAARPYTKAAPMIAAVYDWSGFYIGVNGGWGSSRKCWDSVTAAGAFAFAEGCHDATGGTAGGQVGIRWQSSAWVFGLEAQGNWADFKGDNLNIGFAGFRNQTRIDAFGLFTGQVGYAFNNALFYVKGGAAVTSERFRVSSVGIPVEVATSGGYEARWGGAVGVGIDYGFAPNWSVGVEYDHMFMQDKTYTLANNGVVGPVGTVFDIVRIRQDVDLVTVHVNYKFGGPVIAKY
jgi:outer membrane immunogenic protein